VDFLYPLKRDPKKLARANELIIRDKEIQAAKKIDNGELAKLEKLK
jgi:hypothetical protein